MNLWRRLVLGWLWPLALLAQTGPDERVLWQLYHAQKYRLLEQAIAEYQKQYPGWRPPAELTRLVARRPRRLAPWRAELDRALRRGDASRLIRLARRHPQAFTCRRVEALAALAKAYAQRGEEETALLWYRRALSCPKARVAPILHEALWQVSPEAFAVLLDEAKRRLSKSAHAELAYQNVRRQVFSSLNRPEARLVSDENLLRQALAHRDRDLIEAVAWAQYRQGEFALARAWFAAGLKLAPYAARFALGLLHSLARLGEDAAVIQLAQRYPKLRRPAAGYLLTWAWERYRQGEYRASQKLAEQAARWLPQAEEAQYLLGWLHLMRGEYRAAQDTFAALLKAHPERSDYARALVTSHLQAGQAPERLAERFSQPALLAELSPHLARRAFERKQFLRAYRLDPQAFAELGRLFAPTWGLGGMARFKSGQAGLDRLETAFVPAYAGSYASATHQFALHLGRIELTSDRFGSSAIRALQASQRPLSEAQQAALAQEAQALRRDPPPRAVEAAWMELAYRQEGGLNPTFKLGLTPIGGELAPRPTARLTIGDFWEVGAWQLRWEAEAFRQPIRQSLLSYTGWELAGKRWGRVLRNGLKLSGWGRIGPFALYQALEGAFLDGQGTQDNWMVGYHLAAGYSPPWPGFDYLSLGPYFHFLHYAHNQNHFRPGYGGYFSPQAFYAGGIQLALRTEEGRRFLLESRLALGGQHFREAAAPWFARGCDSAALCGLQFPRNQKTSFAPAAQLRFVLQLHPQLQLAGGVYARQTQGWREAGGGLWVRVLFEPGAAVFSADLPEALFAELE
ncbi:hypothetical protein JCM13664_05280 [Methylothermus subterraneus]